jgi:hypothetical protein
VRSTGPLRSRALNPLLTAILGAAALGSAPAAAGEELSPDASDKVTVDRVKPLLEEPLHGRKAIEGLGDQLAVAAARNDLRPAELRTLLRTDSAAWVDPQGAVFYVDPAHEGADVAVDGAPQAQVAPLSETFQLHSNPTASRTILLDFDGAYVGGTAWNTQSGVTAAAHPVWDPAGNGAAFSDSERQLVQQVWAMVAEDYAPFDVDVTTEDLGTDRIERSSSSDAVYGTRVLVTPSDDPFLKICNRQCGGVAYLDVYDQVGSGYQPAWVFPQALGNSAKNIAEAASHEAGHNLGLEHDGTETLGYYTGHGPWAPIMGVGYERPLVQWSAGSYSGANNGQDDLAVLTGYLGARQDEAAGSAVTPTTLPVGEAVIGTPADVDAFVLGTCAANAVVSVQPSALAPNLDVRATLVDAAGVERVLDAPVSGFGDGTTATGLGASLTVPGGGDGWVLTVEGVGEGSWAGGGYDDYASLGAYTVSAPGCDGALAEGVPGEPGGVVGSAGGTDNITLTWSAPTTEGDGPVTGYVVSRSGSATTEQLGADARSHTFTGLTAATTYELSVRAVNATGAGRTITVSARTTDPDPVAPSAPRDLTGRYVPGTGQIEAYWTEPASTGTAPISGYDIYLDGSYVGQMPSTSRGVALTMTGGFAEGQYVVGVSAVSSAGASPTSAVPVTVDLPDRPANDDIANAAVLSGPSGLTPGDNAYATRESTDPTPPTPYAAGGYSVWYSWTPDEDGPVDMRTSGGAFGRDTTLAAYTGQPGALTQVAGADDTYVAHAGISFSAVAGTRYLIAVDGFTGTNGSGPFTLSWSQTIPQAPSAPGQVAAQPGDTMATVSWTAPNANGSPITSYTVTSSPDGVTKTVAGDSTTATVGGLANGTPYTFTVTATNAIGDSPASEPSTPVTPQTQDTAGPVVSNFDFTPKTLELNDGQKQVTVSARLTDATGANTPTMILSSDTTSQTLGFGQMSRVSGTAQDGVYERTVTIPTTAAPGTWSVTLYPVDDTLGNDGPSFQDHPTKLTITNTPPATAPEAPTGVTAIGGDQSATLTWAKPSDNGSPITGYTVTSSPGGLTKTIAGADTTSTTMTELSNGTAYNFTVVATNAVGDSPASSPSNTVIPAGVPEQMQAPKVVVRGSTAILKWTAADPNGSPITRYKVDISKGKDRTLAASAQKTVFKKLKPGRYRVRVAAHNGLGSGSYSTWAKFRIR